MKIPYNQEVDIPAGRVMLKGQLSIPRDARAIIVFSHGSGSSRFSKRNQKVALYLQKKNFGTLLLDLLTMQEDQVYENRFNIDLLTRRLAGATEWLKTYAVSKKYRIGLFGASTGAASALKAATVLPYIDAIVSRGGRPDLVMDDLPAVKAPTLLIVGSLDLQVLQLNMQAYAKLDCVKEFHVIEGATHLFEEYGKMELVCEKAGSWFDTYLHQQVAARADHAKK